MGQWDEVYDLVIAGSGGGSMCAALAAKELDVSSMSLKEVIRWTNARERVLLAEERRLRVRCALEP